jgi:hypothetical protein
MAQSQAAPQHPFVSKDCGFRVILPAGWKIKASGSNKCAFTVLVPDRPDGKIELTVRNDTVEHGEQDLGFKLEGGKWILKGEKSADAEAIDAPTWKGLVATITKKEPSGQGQETRILLTSLKGRIAEIVGYPGEDTVTGFVDGFEFLSEPAS